MRENMDKLAILPFSVGCASYSSIAVCDNQTKKTKEDQNPPLIREGDEGEEVKMSSLGYHLSQKANVPSGLQRLIKGFKSFSQLFAYKEEEVVGKMEMEIDMKMEIGFPTDVKHVTHIGWDDCSTTTAADVDDLTTPPHFLSLPSLSVAHASSVTVT